MHYVNRGPEPTGLKTYRNRYTHRWVEYYKQRVGSKPKDSHWRKFHKKVGEGFSFLCGYCEENCKGEVDHFRPKCRFPQQVYEWSNWVFSCHDCNNAKGEKWPNGGYIDPCDEATSSLPEQFFEFDLKTGEIKPKARLTRGRWEKAIKMIDDLKLNAFHHLRNRLLRINLVSEVLKGENEDDPDHEEFVSRVSARSCQLSSITRLFLAERGYSVT